MKMRRGASAAAALLPERKGAAGAARRRELESSLESEQRVRSPRKDPARRLVREAPLQGSRRHAYKLLQKTSDRLHKQLAAPLAMTLGAAAVSSRWQLQRRQGVRANSRNPGQGSHRRNSGWLNGLRRRSAWHDDRLRLGRGGRHLRRLAEGRARSAKIARRALALALRGRRRQLLEEREAEAQPAGQRRRPPDADGLPHGRPDAEQGRVRCIRRWRWWWWRWNGSRLKPRWLGRRHRLR